MQDIISDIRSSVRRLSGELENFQDIARHIRPDAGEIPQLAGLDIYGETMPLNGVIGGDHIVFVDFDRRYEALLHGSHGVDFPLVTGRHAAIFADSGMPSAVIRLIILTAINASVFCESRPLARRRSPIMRLYRYIPFSA